MEKVNLKVRGHSNNTWHSRCQFHQRLTCAFFVQKFLQSQNVTRKKAFVRKIRAFNVDEIDHRRVKQRVK